MPKEITLKQLKNTYLQAANIVAVHGEKYLPIFERLESEYMERKKKIDTLNRALKAAKNMHMD
tara:strand:+ start:537 stop:725 length:189 start_codon:yes stop_codon:yes gene_type:complete